MITIIGIGAEKGDISLKAAKKIAASKHVYLRSQKTAAGSAVLKEYPHVEPLDGFFERAENFDALCEAVCKKLTDADSEYGEAVYLTDGDGTDEIAAALCGSGVNNSTATADINVEFIRGVAPAYARSAQIGELRLSAYEAARKKPYIDTSIAVHITEVDDAYLAGDIKLWLMEYYSDETAVTVYIKHKLQTVPLCEIDRLRGYDYSCEIGIAAQEGFFKDRYCFSDLLRIMSSLTAPDGCPWDKAQTHESIRENMIEEAYEAVDAINAGDIDAMTEELGDVLLQAVFHCDMAKRFGEFELSDVIQGLCSKLVHRHTHIFGGNKANDPDEALGFWEQAKSVEKSYVSTADKINRLPQNFPALLAAEKVYKKLVKAGVSGEEIKKAAYLPKTETTEEQFGRRLFALCADASDSGTDAEVALCAFVAALKKKFADAEKNGDVADFLNGL